MSIVPYVRPVPKVSIKPIAERYEGENLPYRGIEDHGVPVWDKPAPLDAPELDHEKDGEFDYPTKPVKPVAVEVVNFKCIETTMFQMPVPTTPMQVLGKDRTRVRTLIRCDDDVVYIGNSSSINDNVGTAFLSATDGFTEIKGTNEIWVVCATGDTSSVFVIAENEVDLETVE